MSPPRDTRPDRTGARPQRSARRALIGSVVGYWVLALGCAGGLIGLRTRGLTFNYVATRPLSANQVLRAEDFRHPDEISPVLAFLLPNPTRLTGRILKHEVDKGRPILPDNLSMAPELVLRDNARPVFLEVRDPVVAANLVAGDLVAVLLRKTAKDVSTSPESKSPSVPDAKTLAREQAKALVQEKSRALAGSPAPKASTPGNEDQATVPPPPPPATVVDTPPTADELETARHLADHVRVLAVNREKGPPSRTVAVIEVFPGHNDLRTYLSANLVLLIEGSQEKK